MVSQCANPECGAPFLYLREGKLIALRSRNGSTTDYRVEVFWLCGSCVNHLQLEMSDAGKFTFTPKAETPRSEGCAEVVPVGKKPSRPSVPSVVALY